MTVRQDPVRRYDIMFDGPMKSGKTSLLHTLSTGVFPTENAIGNNQNDSCTLNKMVDSENVKIDMIDGRIIRKSYNGHPTILLICIDISRDQRLVNAYLESFQWTIKNANVYLILVGTKSDLRWTQNENKLLSTTDMKSFCVKVGAMLYIELSAIHMTKDGIDDFFRRIIRAHMVYDEIVNEAPWIGMKLPHTMPEELSLINSELLIDGYVHQKSVIYSLEIPSEIKQSISSFYVPSINAYFENFLKTNRCLNFYSNFGASEELKSNYWKMFWCDLMAIVIHNVAYYLFSIQLYLSDVEYHSWGGFAASMCVMETGVILCYYHLLFRPSNKYYTTQMYPLHLMIESCINSPMIIIQIVYVLNTEKEIIECFYISIGIYLLFGLYKCLFCGLYWRRINFLSFEASYMKCVKYHYWVWSYTMIIVFIVSALHMVANRNRVLSVCLLVISVISFLVLSAVKWKWCPESKAQRGGSNLTSRDSISLAVIDFRD